MTHHDRRPDPSTNPPSTQRPKPSADPGTSADSRRSPSARGYIVCVIAVILGALFALAASQGGQTLGGIPLIAIGIGIAFLVQWIVFVPSFLARTEHFFDLTGSLTYITVTLALLAMAQTGARAVVLAVMIVLWALRLGTFLFLRVRKAGKDGRFDDRKNSLPAFLAVWTVQGLWVSTTALAAWIAITSEQQRPLGPFAVVGILLWVAGLTIEVVADVQKSRFKADPANEGEFITTGLWSRSRHPNYFGEIMLWCGVALVALPALSGWQWIGLISPLFVTLLLTKVSGIPLLEQRGRDRWGDRGDYQAYLQRTPVLIPKLKS